MDKKVFKLNTKKSFLLNLPHFVKYSISGQVFISVLLCTIFSVSVEYSQLTQVVSLIANFLALAFIYKLAFDVMADVARGNMSPFVKKNFLVADEVIIKVVFISLMIEMIAFMIIEKGYGYDTKLIFIAVTIFLMPAIYMLIALTDSLLIAFNPLKLMKVISFSVTQYFLFVIFQILLKFILEAVIKPSAIDYLPPYVEQIVFISFKYVLLIINFQIMGYLIFQNRFKFHLEDIGFKIIKNDDLQVEYTNIVAAHENIKKHLLDDEPDRALSIAIELMSNGDKSQELQDLHAKALKQKIYTPNNLDISDRVHKHLNNRNPRKAYSIVIEHIKSDKIFLEKSAFDISRLIQFAIISNQTKYIAFLLKDFHIKYPYHEDIVLNYFELAKVLYKDRKTRKKSKIILQFLIDKYPNDRSLPEIKAWYKGLKLIARANNKLLWP